MLTIIYTNDAEQFIRKLKSRHTVEDIEAAINSLAFEPVPHNVDEISNPQLQWSEGRTYRIRVKDYRIIYAHIPEKNIIVIRIAHRDDKTYRV
jgi:mRNA-degrading endonuclease RelE of RelBE toxin-antitoxin system